MIGAGRQNWPPWSIEELVRAAFGAELEAISRFLLLGRREWEHVPFERGAPRIHVSGVAGRHYDHRHFDCAALPGRSGGPRSGETMACNNNLKQIGLAIHNYTQAQVVFPPGNVCTESPWSPPARWRAPAAPAGTFWARRRRRARPTRATRPARDQLPAADPALHRGRQHREELELERRRSATTTIVAPSRRTAISIWRSPTSRAFIARRGARTCVRAWIARHVYLGRTPCRPFGPAAAPTTAAAPAATRRLRRRITTTSIP